MGGGSCTSGVYNFCTFLAWRFQVVKVQVWDMLPGGVSVVGLCLMSQSFTECAATSLHKLTRRLCKPRASLPASLLPHRLLIMHFSTVTERYVPYEASVMI